MADTIDRSKTRPEQGDPYYSRITGKPMIGRRVDPVIYGDGEPPSLLGKKGAAEYEENGFVVLHDVFSHEEITALQQEMNRLRRDKEIGKREEVITEPHGTEFRSIFDIHVLSPVFTRLSNDWRLRSIAEYLLADDIYIHQSRLNYKPGFEGKEFNWHSDFETWHMEDGMPRMRAVSMSIALSENNEFNGPLMLIPGSHRQYVRCVGETPEDHYKQSLKNQEYGVPDPDLLRALADEGGIVAPKGPPGTLTIFECNTMHGSNSNISPYPRSNAFFVFNAVGNALKAPFGGTKPRPPYIARRHVPGRRRGISGG